MTFNIDQSKHSWMTKSQDTRETYAPGLSTVYVYFLLCCIVSTILSVYSVWLSTHSTAVSLVKLLKYLPWENEPPETQLFTVESLDSTRPLYRYKIDNKVQLRYVLLLDIIKKRVGLNSLQLQLPARHQVPRLVLVYCNNLRHIRFIVGYTTTVQEYY